jgi:hypothetical protein
MSVTGARARLAGLRRTHKDPNDPVVIAAYKDLEDAKVQRRREKLLEAIKLEAETDPPMSDQQRTRLAILLAPTSKAG